MSSDRAVDVVRENSNWTIRINKENQSAKQFESDFGYLFVKKPEKHTELPHARATTKYHHMGRYTLTQKKIHLEGKASLLYKEQEAMMQRLATQITADGASSSISRPGTALESTLVSHQRLMTDIERSVVGFRKSSNVYGSRLTLEQFGISDHGIKETRTKLPPQ